MQRKHMAALVAVGLAAITGLIILWRASRTDADTAATANRHPGAAGDNAPASGAAGPAARTGAPAPRPQLPAPGAGAPGTGEGDVTATGDLEAAAQATPGSAARDDGGAGTPGPRVYVRDDGVMVRDHRTRAAPPMMSGTVTRPQRTITKVAPTTVVAVRNAMRPIVYGCLSDTPAHSLGADPRLQGVVVISIAASKLTIDDVTVQTRDVEDPGANQLQECVVQRMKPVTLAIPGSEDVKSHTVTLPFRLRQ